MNLNQAFIEAIRSWYNDHEYTELGKMGKTMKYDKKYFSQLENSFNKNTEEDDIENEEMELENE